MFQSSGFFKQVPCPFFKHDLCHRPYCHFKHTKPPKSRLSKEKESGSNETVARVQEKNDTKTCDEGSSQIETVNDDVMNIVKNIPQSKLVEYAKRKQEVRELQETLANVDKERSVGNPTLRSDEEVQRGLIDSFYSKAKVPVNITSGDMRNSKDANDPSLNDITEALGTTKVRRICHCDDPDCSGFLEDDVECEGAAKDRKQKNLRKEIEHLSSIDLSKIDDEYMRRKFERRLDRKKKMLMQSDSFPVQSMKRDTNDLDNGFDEDLSNYIEKCKREYFLKKAERLSEKCKEENDNQMTGESSDKYKVPYENKINENLSEKCKGEKEKVPEKSDEKNENEQIDKNDDKALEKPKIGHRKIEEVNPSERNEENQMKKLDESLEKHKFEFDSKKKEMPVEGCDEKCRKKEKQNASKQKENKRNENTPDVGTKENTTKKIEHSSEKNKEEFESEIHEKSSSCSKISGQQKKEKLNSSKEEHRNIINEGKKNNKVLADINFFSSKVPQCNLSELDSEDSDKDCPENKHKRRRKQSASEEVASIDDSTEVQLPKKKKVKRESNGDNVENSLKSKTKKELHRNGHAEDGSLSKKKKKKEEGQCNNAEDDSMAIGITNRITNSSVEEKHKPNNLDDADNSKIKKVIKNCFPKEKNSDKSIKTLQKDVRKDRKLSNKEVDSVGKDLEAVTKATICSMPISKRDFVDSNDFYEVEEQDGEIMINGDAKKGNRERIRMHSGGDEMRCKEGRRTNSESEENLSNRERIRAYSESSNASRNAFDVIMISDDESGDNKLDLMETKISHGKSNIDEYEKKGFTSVKKDKDVAATSKGPAEPKKRIALSNEEIHRKVVQCPKRKTKTLSYVSPTLAGGGPPVNKSVPPLKPAVPSKGTAASAETFYNGKKRIAHAYEKPAADKEERPKLPIEIGGKVPHLIRQRYFDKIIDELIPKVVSEKEAFTMAFKEEADACQRSNRKQIYLSICANIIKRIRSMPDYVAPKELPQPDPMKTAEPTTSLLTRIKSTVTSGYKKLEKADKVNRMAGKKCIKPASSNLINAAATIEKTPQPKKISTPSTESTELTEDNFYDHMKQYVLTDEQLWENKYPHYDPDNPEVAKIKDYVPSSNTLKRVCCRCGKDYRMNQKGKYVTKDECHYHFGKLIRQRGRGAATMIFTCCGAQSDGLTCSMCRLHVSNKVGPLKGFVSTEKCSNMDSRRKVFALDCEMCYTTEGLELTRLTVVDFDLEQIIDLFVKPSNPIVDYNTRFSGVTKEHLQDVTTTIEDIHDILLNLFDKETILLGHSLESDLNALNMIHNKVVDTSVVFPHRMGPPLKRALRNLMVDYLQKVIQSGDGGHDSCEDARSCMELMKYKFKEDKKKIIRAIQKPVRRISLIK